MLCAWRLPTYAPVICGKVLNVVSQFLQLPLLVIIIIGCVIFWGIPYDCTSPACANGWWWQSLFPTDGGQPNTDNSTDIKRIVLPTTTAGGVLVLNTTAT